MIVPFQPDRVGANDYSFDFEVSTFASLSAVLTICLVAVDFMVVASFELKKKRKPLFLFLIFLKTKGVWRDS